MYCSSKWDFDELKPGWWKLTNRQVASLAAARSAASQALQLAVRPVDRGVGVEDRPVSIAVVEREIGHSRKGGAGCVGEGFEVLIRSEQTAR